MNNQPDVGIGTAPSLERRSVIAALAVAGIAGPIIFVLVVIVQSLLHPVYSQVKLPISALAAWPRGWVQSVNFAIFGLLMISFAIGLHLGVRHNRAAVRQSVRRDEDRRPHCALRATPRSVARELGPGRPRVRLRPVLY
jgi:Protein of unknown function (DUF998)